MKIGRKEIEYNEQFRMYFVSNDWNPKFASQIYSSTIIVNFTITLMSLENQLLDILFGTLDPLSTKELATLKMSIAINCERLHQLETDLQTQIALCDGNLPDNPDTMKLLECTKLNVLECHRKSIDEKSTLSNIEMKRNDFRLIARKAASLYFVLADMVAYNQFYQYAVYDFIEIFTHLVADRMECYESMSEKEFLSKIITDFSKRIYNIWSLGFFYQDKLLISLRIAMELAYYDAKLNRKEIEFLLKSTTITTTAIHTEVKCFDEWLSDKQYNDIHLLETVFPVPFGELLLHIEMNIDKWKVWYHCAQPETINYPEPYDKITTDFQVKKKFQRNVYGEETRKKSNRVVCRIHARRENSIYVCFSLPPP